MEASLTLWSIAGILYLGAWSSDNRFLEALAITTALLGFILLTGVAL